MIKILLNEREYIPTENDLPCLVIYRDKSGGSHYTVTMVANMFVRGSKILFLTAYPMAKDNFYEQVGVDNQNVAFVTNTDELNENKSKQCLILESGNEALFMESLKSLPDLNERVVLIKNIEKFSEEIILKSLGFEKVILSGDLDASVLSEKIVEKHYATIIAFSKPVALLPVEVPELEKYSGYLWSEKVGGITKLEIS